MLPIIVDLPPQIPPLRILNTDRTRGRLVVHVRPADRTSADHASTLLEGLGKRLDLLHRRTLSVQHRRELTKVWLRAYCIDTVVLCSPQMLNRRNLNWLLDLLSPAQRVVFACDHGASGPLRRLLPDAHRDTWESIAAALTGETSSPANLDAHHPSYRFEDLPDTDFLTFRADCRHDLGRQTFAELDRLYLPAFRAAQRVPAEEQAVLEHFQRHGGELATAGQLLVLIRATQAAFFRRGYLLRVHRDRLLGTLATLRTTTAHLEHFRVVHASVLTVPAAVCALHLMDMSIAAMLRLTISDAARQAGRRRQHAGGTDHPGGVFLRAQLLWRQGRGATDDDLLLPIGAPQASKILAEARRDLDLPIDAGNARTASHRDTRRYTRLGMKLEQLT
jgi:hypothetical protein